MFLQHKLVTILGLSLALGQVIAGESYSSPDYKLHDRKTPDTKMKEASYESSPSFKVHEGPEAQRELASEEGVKKEPMREPNSESESAQDEIKKMEEERWGSPKEQRFIPTYWKYERP